MVRKVLLIAEYIRLL